MGPVDAAVRWARVWHDAWEAQDTEAIVALYAPDVVFSTHAFRVPYRGRDGVRGYVARAFDEERAPRVWTGAPIVAGDRAAIEWWAAVIENDVEITLAGVSVLRFDADGLVTDQRDSWNQGEGLMEPAPGWGQLSAGEPALPRREPALPRREPAPPRRLKRGALGASRQTFSPPGT